MTDILIRQHTAEDLPRCLEIWLTSNLSAHDFIDESYWRANLPLVEQLLPQSDLWVACVGEMIVAFAGVTDGGYLAGIFVDEAYRSQGIGGALLDHLKMRYPVLSLNVYAQNTRAVNFYRRHGFVLEGEEPEPDTGFWEYYLVYQGVN